MLKLFSLLIALCFSYSASSATLLILGDSLSAGYKMSVKQSWPALLPLQLQQQGKPLTVINASISGDTTGNGLARFPALLIQHKPDYVLIELGANDGLRGFSSTLISNNLKAIIKQSKAENAQPLLMQIHVPSNYGKRYSAAFSGIYPTLSEQYNVPLVPFFLEQVILKKEWMMSDGLHPNAKAQPWIAHFMAQELTKVIQ